MVAARCLLLRYQGKEVVWSHAHALARRLLDSAFPRRCARQTQWNLELLWATRVPSSGRPWPLVTSLLRNQLQSEGCVTLLRIRRST